MVRLIICYSNAHNRTMSTVQVQHLTVQKRNEIRCIRLEDLCCFVAPEGSDENEIVPDLANRFQVGPQLMANA